MSVIRVDNFGPSAGGTTYSARGIAKAWVNFDGTGTIAARDSENVSSLTDNGTGDYTVNFSDNFSNSNYAALGTGASTSGGDLRSMGGDQIAYTASSFRFRTRNGASSAADTDFMNVAAHGDLA